MKYLIFFDKNILDVSGGITKVKLEAVFINSVTRNGVLPIMGNITYNNGVEVSISNK